MADEVKLPTQQVWLQQFLPALKWLDQLIERAVMIAQVVYSKAAIADGYQGLYISQDDVQRLLAQAPGSPLLSAPEAAVGNAFANLVQPIPRLTWLKKTFALDDFDLALILIVLAPEIDLRYERLYGYLQDDVTRKRASIDLALNLLCSSDETKLQRWQHFAPIAPLIRHQLIHLIVDPHQLQPPLLAYSLRLDDQIVRWLLGQQGLDARLVSFCQRVEPTSSKAPLLSEDVIQAVRSLSDPSIHPPLCFYFYGPPGMGQRRTAEAIAHELGKPLLIADLAKLMGAKLDIESTLNLLVREAQFQSAVLYLDGLDSLRTPEQTITYQQVIRAATQATGLTILAGSQPWTPIATECSETVTLVPFPMPNFAQRRVYWQAHLSEMAMQFQESDLDDLADRFRLTPDQITQAIATAQNQARWRGAQNNASQLPTLNDLFAAARDQSGHGLALARKIETPYTWSDLILPSDQLAQLQEICNQIKYRHIVYGKWNFDRKLALGKGLSVLFSGTPGTGKTMAASVIANRLQLDLYKIDLSQIVSKYIGETEKNLDRIFTLAEGANAILLFDEADALFGKRSEVKDAHDRYANIEIAYLLQKMEEYEGMTILTTNLRQNLDDAFTRRVRFIVEFPFPETDYRLQIWQGIWSPETPLQPDVDLYRIAQQFQLAGGSIRNIALAAAFLAAEAGQSIGMNHLLQATKREFQKMGRLISEAEYES